MTTKAIKRDLDHERIAEICVDVALFYADGHPLHVLCTTRGLLGLTPEDELTIHRILYEKRASIPFLIRNPDAQDQL